MIPLPIQPPHPPTSGQSTSNATEKPKRKHRKKDNPSTSSPGNQSSACNSPEATESSPGTSNSEAPTSSASVKSRSRNRKIADPDNKPQKRKRGSSSSRRKRGDSIESTETNQHDPSSSSSSNSSPPLSSNSNETEASNSPRFDVSLNGSHEEEDCFKNEASAAASQQGTSAPSEQRTSVATEHQQPAPTASSSSGNEDNAGPNNNGDFRSRFNDQNTKVIPLRHCSELIVGQLYQILNVQRVNTKFGTAIRAEMLTIALLSVEVFCTCLQDSGIRRKMI
ncbi:RNA polymerase-associated protein CTR9-like protein [Frankliniella fusca]|uniref:RNA polymerase-associated protein CTR9-like protein n=1 Tax=Frankliniella fusca TaxID=407009 RepID=A0AAE1LE25_9NEOP|nr:RNA polymerase-associated protein CTR9-like protein [Frankliniella fusca]